MKNDFLEISEIFKKSINLFSWYKSIGVEYLGISEESINEINSWHKSNNSASLDSNISSKKLYHQTDNRVNESQKTSKTRNHNYNKSKSLDGTPEKLNNPPASYIKCIGSINSQIFVFSETLDYDSPAGELFLKILKAMKLNKDNICLCTFKTLNYAQGISKVKADVNNIRKEAGCIFNKTRDKKVRTDNNINSKIICSFGDSALKILMGREYMLSNSRGKFQAYNGIYLMPTYHPAQILKDKNLKKFVWEDVKQIMGLAGL